MRRGSASCGAATGSGARVHVALHALDGPPTAVPQRASGRAQPQKTHIPKRRNPEEYLQQVASHSPQMHEMQSRASRASLDRARAKLASHTASMSSAAHFTGSNH